MSGSGHRGPVKLLSGIGRTMYLQTQKGGVLPGVARLHPRHRDRHPDHQVSAGAENIRKPDYAFSGKPDKIPQRPVIWSPVEIIKIRDEMKDLEAFLIVSPSMMQSETIQKL